jgi:glycosyltransferase involved in cell wall biosynthesis
MVRGGQIHVRNVVNGLRNRGHDVHLIDWNPNSEEPFHHSIDPRTRFVDGPVRTVLKLLRVCRQVDPDVIVSKTRKVYLPGLVAGQILDIPHVVHVGSSPESTTENIFDRLDAASFSGRLRAPHDAYFVVCETIAEQLRTRGVASDKIANVRNAVDATRFTSNPDVRLPGDVRTRVTEIDGPVLGFVGGLVDYKGVFDLVDAMGRCESEPTLVVAGDGPARTRFERELGDTGVFLGSVAYERMPAVYAAIDALVLPSHTEGLPRVILEAGAAGLPVVATRVGGVPEVVRDGETGLLCPPKEPRKLGEALDDLFLNRDTAAMGEAARQLVVDEFTWESQYDRYERYLRRVIEIR